LAVATWKQEHGEKLQKGSIKEEIREIATRARSVKKNGRNKKVASCNMRTKYLGDGGGGGKGQKE